MSRHILGAVTGICLVLLVLSCDHAGEAQKGWLEVKIAPIEQKQSHGLSRSLSYGEPLGPEYSKLVADAYELVVLEEKQLLFTTVVGNVPTVLRLDPGNYELVVLAGVRRSSSASTVCLVGSGESEGLVEVKAGVRSEASILLYPISFEMESPTQAAWGEDITVRARGSSGNTRVGMAVFGSTAAVKPRLKSQLLWGSTAKDFDSIEGNENSWEVEISFTLPMNQSSIDLQFLGSAVLITFEGGESINLSGTSQFTWKWPSRSDMNEDSPLVDIVEFWVEGLEPETGVDIHLGWA